MQENTKKLNIVLPGLGASGGMEVVKKYKDLLTQKGWDVIIYAPIRAYNLHRYNSAIKNWIHQIYCTLKTLKEKKYKHEYKWVWKICNKAIRNAEITMATSWTTVFDVYKLDAAKGKKVHFIQDYEVWDNEKYSKKAYLLPLKKIVISTWINKKLEDNLGIGPFPIIYNGIDHQIFHKVSKEKRGEKYSFLMLNHKLAKKGVANGISSYEEIADRFPNCVLRMFGMCDSANLPDYIEYYQNPSQEQLLDLYSQSDIFIFPSIEEGWGLTPLEAMACGCVVVGTNTGFVIDLGIHNENMMISEPGDVVGMTRNIEQLITDSNLMEVLKQNGFSTACSLDWDASAEKLNTVLKTI